MLLKARHNSKYTFLIVINENRSFPFIFAYVVIFPFFLIPFQCWLLKDKFQLRKWQESLPSNPVFALTSPKLEEQDRAVAK